jgi:putative ABC transport system permease protein
VWTVTLADLRMRSRQFAIAVMGATLVFAMALVMAGLSGGFRAEAGRTVAAAGADAFVVPVGGGGPFSSPATGHGPVFVHLLGVRVHGLGTPAITAGRLMRADGEAVADRLTHLHLGDRFSVGPRRFTVVGLTSGMSYLAGTPSVYVTLRNAQAAAFAGRPDMTTVAVVGAPHRLPAGLHLMSADEARQDILTPLSNGITSIDIVRDFLWAVAAVIIGAVVYLSALERRRDFAVLKAIGSSTRWLYAGMAAQASLISMVSGLLALVIQPLLAQMIPMQLAVPLSARAALPAVALLIGMLASLSGLRQAVRADPALAFGSA